MLHRGSSTTGAALSHDSRAAFLCEDAVDISDVFNKADMQLPHLG